MFDRYQEEMDYEFNARYDYIAELKAEHEESQATLDAEAEADYQEWEAERMAFIGPVQPHDYENDDLPF